MDANEGTLREWYPQQLGRTAGHISMAGTVKTVTTNTMLRIRVIGHGVKVSLGWPRLVKGGIENGHLGQFGKKLLGSSYAQQVGGIMQRREMIAIFDCGYHLIIDSAGYRERFTAMDDPMADSHQTFFKLA